MMRVFLTAILLLGVATADGTGDPIYVEVFASDKPGVKLAGHVTEHDQDGVTIEIRGQPTRFGWDRLTPSSAFSVRRRLIDDKDAAAWLELGRWGWDRNLKTQGRSALLTARRLDPALSSQVETILRGEAGAALRQPTDRPASPTSDSPAGPQPADAADADNAPAASDAPSPLAPGFDPTLKIVPYTPATPEQHAAAVERAKAYAKQVEESLEMTLTVVETDHFIIFTDWDAREHKFLRDSCEAAYRLVARQFDVNPRENIFLGKLPVFMFARQRDFTRFADDVDGFPVHGGVLGYFHGSSSGLGHMAMWKPRIEIFGNDAGLRDAERRWARTLLHEFVHAFIHRYRTNGSVPRWLNEGLAELIAEQQFPTVNYFSWARRLANRNADISSLWDDEHVPGGEYYPVMMSLVKMLVEEDRNRFVAMFNDIKDGTKPDEALRKHFNIDYVRLELGWREYARNLHASSR